MLESQTVIRISRVIILIIESLLIPRIQNILVIGSFHEFRWLFIIFFISWFFVGTDMTVDVSDVMHFATFELNISDSLHSAQTNPAIANEAKRTFEFANGNSVGGFGLALEPPNIRTIFFSKIYHFFLQMTTFFYKPMDCSMKFADPRTERRTGPILS